MPPRQSPDRLQPPDAASVPFSECAALVNRLYAVVRDLETQCRVLQTAPLAGREWYELLDRKLIPQLSGEPFIVAAVVGGTNIGKSVVFNHLAGTRASATSPLASGTKHPTCLVPAGFSERHDLAEIFKGFELIPWSEAAAALGETETHQLFWKPAPELPSSLLILDTPDIDSDAPVNWLRADRVRHCADVLVAVLTQQKYNDAAVKQFFRKAAAEDKAIVLVFNQCLLPEDEQYWPRWLETFSRETGITPDVVYVAPNDRRAAEENRLPFYERSWPIPEGFPAGVSQTPRRLRDDLAEMKFTEIKLRTLRGSLRHITSEELGVPAYLNEVKARTAGFQDAASLLSMQHLAKVDNWPSPSNGLLVAEIKRWWRLHREGMTKKIHDTYATLGEFVAVPFRWATKRLKGDPPDPNAVYSQQERDLMLRMIDTVYEELTRQCQLGNEILRPRLEELLAGRSRSSVLNKLTEEHAKFSVENELREVVETQMEAFRTRHR
ncbi:MAG: GTPase domain-containing protein [Planctomycetota bacterium]|nr:GTPase domain-containing protein [Planctomycetota bacterium]